MNEIKRDDVTSEMRERLLANRHGKLTSSQWWDMITEPLVMVLLLLAPGIIILRFTLVSLFIGGFWMVGLALIVGLVAMLVWRARRYARMAVQFATLYAGSEWRPKWMFWRAWILND